MVMVCVVCNGEWEVVSVYGDGVCGECVVCNGEWEVVSVYGDGVCGGVVCNGE